MPAFAADYFGPKNVGPIYGLMLTAWGFASAFGPLLIAHMRETAGSYRGALHVIAGVMAISALLPILVRPPRTRDTGTTKAVSHPLPKEVAGITPRITP
jgi:OFA family oxalate/formate antiporter-like MFS transporter